MFKGGKLYLQAKFLYSIIEGFLAAKRCPMQPGVSLTGVEPWAKDLPQKCFDAYVKLFNVIPGQPTDTLVGNLNQYYFPNCTVSLDLSNKALDWRTVYNITKALLDHNITVEALNLSGNALGLAEVFMDIFPTLSALRFLDLSYNQIGYNDNVNASGTVALGEGIATLKTLTSLDLSDNWIGLYDNIDASGTVAVGEGVGALRTLTSLDLFNNHIGSHDYVNASGTVALGEGIAELEALTSLDLSANEISSNVLNPSGTVALGEGIGALRALISLDLSQNKIGYLDAWNAAAGTIALGKGIGALRTLTSLDLSSNDIGASDNGEAAGTMALGEGIGALKALISLDLSINAIGDNDDVNAAGTIALGEGVGALRTLTSLDISNNDIGANDHVNASGTVALGEGISKLKGLTSLDLSQNTIGCYNGSGVESFIASLAFLNKLKSFSFMPQLNPETGFPCLSDMVIQKLNEALKYTKTLPLVALFSLEDVEAYCRTLPFSVKTVNLSTIFLSNLKTLVIRALMACLKNRPLLTSLDLSNNLIGVSDNVDASATVVLGEGLSALRTLTSLDLSNNYIGCKDNVNASGTMALGEGIGALRALTFLNLSDNLIGFNDNVNASGTLAFGQGIRALKLLTVLDFSMNALGYYDNVDVSGTVALGEGMRELKALTFLDLSSNHIGYNDNIDASGTIALGEGIGALTVLTSLDLSYNGLGGNDNINASGTMLLGERIGFLKVLTSLNLANNYLSWTPSILTLANGLNFTRHLALLNLGHNFIGSMGPAGPKALLSVLPYLSDLEMSHLDLSGMTNVSWTSAADVLQQLRSQELMAACQNSRCFGGNVGTPSHTGGLLPAKSAAVSFHHEYKKGSVAALSFARSDAQASLQARQVLALSEPEYPIQILTSGASSPSSFLREATRGLSSAYQSLWDIANHPDVQTMGYIYVGTKLTAYAAIQTWPLLATYAMLI